LSELSLGCFPFGTFNHHQPVFRPSFVSVITAKGQKEYQTNLITQEFFEKFFDVFENE